MLQSGILRLPLNSSLSLRSSVFKLFPGIRNLCSSNNDEIPVVSLKKVLQLAENRNKVCAFYKLNMKEII
eukprot:Pgem_evm1s4104